MPTRPGVALALWLSLTALRATAQVVPDRELEICKQMFNAGNYADALKRARDAMSLANFTDAQRIELHKLAGLSGFNLGDKDGAERHFLQLLQLNPDYVLDPFAVAPPAIRGFEEVRRKNADALNLIRQNIALREEQAKRDQIEKERAAAAAEADRKRLLELSQQVTVRTVEHRYFLMNFVPFGAGQFMQGRTEWGITFATLETVFAVTSIVAYLAIGALFEEQTLTFTNRIDPADGKVTVKINAIPEARRRDAEVWNAVKLSAGVAFYATWALGVIEALWHHQSDVVTTTTVPSDQRKPQTRLLVFPTSGGAGAGLTVRF